MQNNRPLSPIPGTTASEADYPQPTISGVPTATSDFSDYGVVQRNQTLRDRLTESGALALPGDAMDMDVDMPGTEGPSGVQGIWLEDRDPSSWRQGFNGRWEYVGKATIQEIVDTDDSGDDDAMGRASARSLPSNVSAPPAPVQRQMRLPASSRGGSILSGFPWTPGTQTPGPSTVARRNIAGIPNDMASSWFPGANPEPDLEQANASLKAHQNALAFDLQTPQPRSRNGRLETPPLTPLSLGSGIKTAFTNAGSILSPLSLLRPSSRFTKATSSVMDRDHVQQPPQTHRPAQATHPRLMSLMKDEDHRSTGKMTRERDQSPQSTNTRRATRRRLENEPLAAVHSVSQQPTSTSPASTSLPSRVRSQNGHGGGLGSSSRLSNEAGNSVGLKRSKRGYSDSLEDMYASGASSSKAKGKQKKRGAPSSLVPTESLNENEDPPPRHIRPSQVPTEIIETEEKIPLSLGTPVELFKGLPKPTTSYFPEGYQESAPQTSTPPPPSRRKKSKRPSGLDRPNVAQPQLQSPPLQTGMAARSPIPPIQETSPAPVPPPEGPMRRSPNVSSPGYSSSSLPNSSSSPPIPAPPPIPRKRARSPVKPKKQLEMGHGERYFKEAELLAVTSRLFEVAFKSVDIVCAGFLKIGSENNMLPHVNACHRVKTGMESVKTALRRRSEFSSEQMDLASDRWNSAHVERLGSLQRSLEKLNRLGESVKKLGDQKISVNSANKGQTKLLEFATKFMGLAAKFNSMFDRIEVLHVHDQMTQAYDEARLARHDIEEDLDKWAEAKAKRAKLRFEFETLKRRAGRRAALIS